MTQNDDDSTPCFWDNVIAERDALRKQSESWRKAHSAWQEWAATLLREAGLQPDGGEWGDEVARKKIAERLTQAARDGRLQIGQEVAPPRRETEQELREQVERLTRENMALEAGNHDMAERIAYEMRQLSAVKAARDEACDALDEFAEVIGDVYSAPGAVQFFASLGIDEATVRASIDALPVLRAKCAELRKAGE